MKTELLCTGEVDDITRLLAENHFPDDACFLGEQQPARVVVGTDERQNLLLFVPYEPTLPFAAYTSGRIFHRDFELRWENDNGKTRVVYLGTDEYCPPSLLPGEEIVMQEPHCSYLFGERLQPGNLEKIGKPAREGDFAEVRIPRLLRYPPVPGDARRVLIAICESINEQTGEVEQYRFQGVEGSKQA